MHLQAEFIFECLLSFCAPSSSIKACPPHVPRLSHITTSPLLTCFIFVLCPLKPVFSARKSRRCQRLTMPPFLLLINLVKNQHLLNFLKILLLFILSLTCFFSLFILKLLIYIIFSLSKGLLQTFFVWKVCWK